MKYETDFVNLQILDLVQSQMTEEEKRVMNVKTFQMINGLNFGNFESKLLAEKMFKLGQMAAKVDLFTNETGT